MKISTLLRLSLTFSLLTFVFGIYIYFSSFDFLINERLTSLSSIVKIVDQIDKYIIWNLMVYFIYGVFLLSSSVAMYLLSSGKNKFLRLIFIFTGTIWSCWMFVSASIAIETVQYISEIVFINEKLAVETWNTIRILLEAFGGGNEILGGFWVILFSLLIKIDGIISIVCRNVGFLVFFIGIATAFTNSNYVESLFGIAIITWFLLATLSKVSERE
ncbi:hypothetical protein ATY35_19585 [Vibrio cidicii]|uniref:DUF4386 family protein n=4 Tax=Vibrio cidicii TaxID=1763883 RepID=A0ABR5VXP7_9VIBR|nr:hypothetical protein [Vibrio cidicii]KYN82461.1 hypothetical protein ATY35_19585 [Vibrio cidicii]